MKTTTTALFASIFAVAVLLAQPADYAQRRAEAEKLFKDASFAKAHEIYKQINITNLPPAEARWVEFRRADTQWRAQAATQTHDDTKFEQARDQLEKLVRDVKRQEERDLAWAEVQESLGDFWWTRRNIRNWHQGWQHYQQALDWWAGSSDMDLARERYLNIVWTASQPPQPERYYYGYYGNYLPLEILQNALKIAKTPEDKARAHYLIALTLRNQGDWAQMQRVPDEFEAAIKLGRKTGWYDDALYHYAEWMSRTGRIVPLKEGGWRQEPDYVRALELFRQLVREFKKGETRYFDQAENQIRNITRAVVGVQVSNIFLPDSEIQYSINWRNVKRVDLALYPVDLTRDVRLNEENERRRDWLNSIDLGGRERIKSWSHETKDTGEHKPGREQLRLEEKLKPGAYLIEARGDGETARDIVLVTDAALVLKTSGRQALTYFCNALDGSPLAGAQVRLWQRYHDGQRWQWREAEKQTDKDGLAVFDLSDIASNVEIYAGAKLKDRQAFTLGNSYSQRDGQESWRIYAFTDRPAYRPKETVNWKFIARRYNGSVYATPSGETIWYRIDGPDNALVKEGELKLNEFGTVWGSIDLTEQMRLGEYRVSFRDKTKKHHIGQATLFRLEEYKLPEFKVSVQTPEEDGKKKIFRVGDTVEAIIQADYYFGGPVANANVEVLVYQNPFFHYWHPPREFPWFYEDMDESPARWRRFGGHGQIVKRETLKTDATGKATITFETPANAGQDFEYRIEARVTDASRREITGNGTVRVTRQGYYVYAHAGHHLYRPQDKVSVEFVAQDANSNAMQVEGIAKVTREYWFEVWLAPDGREVKGDELKQLQSRHRAWPPAPERPDQREWRLKFRGYERDEILTRALKTDANGKAELSFTPERIGYYRVSWFSEDTAEGRPPQPIRADTTVWVADNATTEIGYRHGGVQIIVDKDTFRVGQEAPVMLVAPTNDRYVLFSVEGEDLYSYKLVHLSGTVKLVSLHIEEKHVPNIFLSAALVTDRQFHVDTKQVVVPPTRNFLTVDVKPDREQYQPREEGTLLVTTKDHEGKPVSAEVALGLVDESVFYIQSDYAGDPRQFYYGSKRSHRIQTQSTFNQKSYAKLMDEDGKRLVDEREILRRRLAGADKESAEEFRRKADSGLALDAVDGNRGVLFGAVSEMAAAKSGVGGRMLARNAAMAEPAAASPMSGAALELADRTEQLAVQLPGEEQAVQVRADFRATAFWQPDIKTDADGTASVKFTYPDSLTGWKATARAVTGGNQFGIAGAATRTKLPLIVRLQAPRFFVVGDKTVVSAVINNNTDKELVVGATLEFAGVRVEGLVSEKRAVNTIDVEGFQVMPYPVGGPKAGLGNVRIPASGEKRVDWLVSVDKPGEVRLKAGAVAVEQKLSDAMERTYMAHEHGIEKFIANSGKVRGDEVTVKLDLPKERKPGSTTMTVQVTPSLAVTMLDALPYLIDYPYGCTEQTMSRFLPAAITAKTLKDLGLHAEDVMGRVFGGIETQHAAATHPKGKKSLEQIDDMVKKGLERLYDFQHNDGGWGWWKEGDSDHWMSAYVTWGLTLAKAAGVEIRQGVLERAVNYLDKELVEEELNHDTQAFMLHALSAHHSAQKKRQPGKFQAAAFDNLWTNREKLNAYTRALLALSAHHYGKAKEARTLIDNLENGVKRDERPDASVLISAPSALRPQPFVMGTARWGEDGIYWRWSDGGVEATAFALRALLAIDPQNKLVEPVTNWLIKNRRGAQWSNTRDTAIVVLTMNDYLKASGELKADMEYELLVNGASIAKKEVKGADVFNAPSRFEVDAKLIRDGENLIQIRRAKGDTPIYFAAEAKYFSLEEPIPPAGNEIFVRRDYYKLVGRPTLLKGYVYDKVPLKDGESVKSGERIETVITIEAKNNYEYLVFEDLKPAGIEAVEIRSGESLYARELKSGAVDRQFGGGSNQTSVAGNQSAAGGAARQSRAGLVARPVMAPIRAPAVPAPESSDYTGRSRWVYQELRDRKVALFLDKLPEGVWEIRYDFRAEVPGKFHALPVLGHAMYVPEIRANSAEVRIGVLDTPAAR